MFICSKYDRIQYRKTKRIYKMYMYLMYNSKIMSQLLVDMSPLDICSDLRSKMYFESILDKSHYSFYLFVFFFFFRKGSF